MMDGGNHLTKMYRVARGLYLGISVSNGFFRRRRERSRFTAGGARHARAPSLATGPPCIPKPKNINTFYRRTCRRQRPLLSVDTDPRTYNDVWFSDACSDRGPALAIKPHRKRANR
ncbi:hypothetical protein EVAR_88967_1 [Eumeta japonica]|uniref:Uncharacterized protein n=1 Tax=Eumeta variegata TaxID=151549 RepID=A0A4C1VP51_EUMVA|nr:hypothetical protein EVAR_88967_1 [Eumeta japonica]